MKDGELIQLMKPAEVEPPGFDRDEARQNQGWKEGTTWNEDLKDDIWDAKEKEKDGDQHDAKIVVMG